MAHELEFRNGRASMFSVNETPWHRYGTILAGAPTFDDALRLGNLDYEVVRAPTYLPVNDGADFVQSKTAFVTRRTDTGHELGRVGPDYTPIQNVDAFGVLRPLVDSGVLKLETGGVLRNGADAWLLGRWDIDRFGPVVREVFADKVVPFSTVLANHSGRRAVLVGNTPIRIVCANTLGMAETAGSSRWESVTHVGAASTRLVEAAERVFGGVIERYEVIAAQYRALKARALTSDEFAEHVLDLIAPDPRALPSFVPDAKMAESVVARAEAKRDELTRLWTAGRGHVGDSSAWEAYNGVVEALDHDEQGLWPTRGGVYRTASLLDGQYSRMKNTVLDRLVSLAGAR
jgi:phage/plasmid-like protein (TIGR03299 family)